MENLKKSGVLDAGRFCRGGQGLPCCVDPPCCLEGLTLQPSAALNRKEMVKEKKWFGSSNKKAQETVLYCHFSVSRSSSCQSGTPAHPAIIMLGEVPGCMAPANLSGASIPLGGGRTHRTAPTPAPSQRQTRELQAKGPHFPLGGAAVRGTTKPAEAFSPRLQAKSVLQHAMAVTPDGVKVEVLLRAGRSTGSNTGGG